jgi:CRP-like cAMP-binding protein
MFRQHRTEKTVILEQLPLFQGLSQRELRLVEQHADCVAVAAGTTVAHPGRIAREFVVVHEGTLRVEYEGSPAERLYPGDFFGEPSLLSRTPSTATVICERPGSLIVIEARSFAFLIETVPALRRRVLASHGASPSVREMAGASAA